MYGALTLSGHALARSYEAQHVFRAKDLQVTTLVIVSLAHSFIPKVAVMVRHVRFVISVDQMRRDGVGSKRNKANACSWRLLCLTTHMRLGFELEYVCWKKASNRCLENSMLFMYSRLHDPLP